jgi:tetratricopeptide (TPR) repeat protein
LATNLAEVYRHQARYSEAEPLYKRSLAIRENALGADHPAVAIDLNNLATLYNNQGRYADAEPLYKRALAIEEKALGPDHPDVASFLSNMASVYLSQDRSTEAIPIIRRLIDERRASKHIALPALFYLQKKGFLSAVQSFNDSYNVLQFVSSTYSHHPRPCVRLRFIQ